MLYKETVSQGLLDLTNQLMQDQAFDNFFLVGGTALALKLGHRLSVDIDLFTSVDFDAEQMAEHLKEHYSVQQIHHLKNGVVAVVDSIKLDLIAHKYPLLHPAETIEGIRMLSLADIGAMKMNAILYNGTRLKDFVDMYFLLEQTSLENLAIGFTKKYPDVNVQMAYNALAYHEDINLNFEINYIHDAVKFESIAQRLKESVNNPGRTFKKQGKKINTPAIRRGRRI